jgi:hypothetical protein
MAVTRRIIAKGPKILATDRWRGKTRQLRRAGNFWYLGDLILGDPGEQDCAVLN